VLRAARTLVRKGLAKSGAPKHRDYFARADHE
jgi:hypothetical protein